MTVLKDREQPAGPGSAAIPLEQGDHLDRATFHARYEAMPEHVRAELVVEVASGSASIDLHAKKDDDEKAGVREYVVVLVRERRVEWFVRRDGAFVRVAPGEDGLLRSEVVPGLWLDPGALVRRDTATVLAALRRGLETPEHAAFVARLAAVRPE